MDMALIPFGILLAAILALAGIIDHLGKKDSARIHRFLDQVEAEYQAAREGYAR